MFKEKEPIRIFKRLENLHRYFICGVEAPKILMFDTDDKNEFYCFEFQTALGPARISIANNYIWNQSLELEYVTYAGFSFTVLARKDEVHVEPYLGEHLMASDIDLAILELENYLKDVYGPIEDVYTEWENEQKRIKKLHREQLELLK